MASPDPLAQPEAKVTELPVELFTIISKQLSTTDLCSLRSTCRMVEHKTRKAFSKAFFIHKQFMVTTPSLTVLQEISRHPTFSETLQHVSFGTDCYLDTPFYEDVGGPKARAIIDGYADQLFLRNTGKWRDMVVDAFARLPNLRAIDVRDYNSPTRYRDGAGAEWRSAGAVTVLQQTGRELTLRSNYVTRGAWATDIFQNVLLAVAEANVRPSSLEVIMKRTHGINDFALRPTPTMYPFLEGLTKVHLDVLNDTDCNPYDGLKHFLTHVPNVSWLRFNAKSTDASLEYFLRWFGTEPDEPANKDNGSLNNENDGEVNKDGEDKVREDQDKEGGVGRVDDLPPPTLPRLTRLEFGMMTFKPAVLESILAKFPVKTLCLWRVSLDQGDTGTTNLWSDFLKRRAGGSITELRLGMLSQTENYARPAVFGDRPNDSLVTIRESRVPGEDVWAKWAKEVVVKRPTHNNDDNDDDDGEDDDDDSMSDSSPEFNGSPITDSDEGSPQFPTGDGDEGSV